MKKKSMVMFEAQISDLKINCRKYTKLKKITYTYTCALFIYIYI